MPSKTITRGPWRFKWEGGRLADVYYSGKPDSLDCIQVGDYDWEKGEAQGTIADLKTAADEWIKESSADYLAELRYL